MAETRARTIGELLSADADSAAAYRRAELARLESCLADSGPVVAWIDGPDGLGKSSLLDAFCERARSAGAATFSIDFRTVEPTTARLLGALGELLGQPVDGVESASSGIASRADRVVLAFDNYGVFRLADSWLRREFTPALDAATRVVLVSSEPPAAGWISDRRWQQYLLEIPLEPDADASPEQHVEALLDEIENAELRHTVEAISVLRRITKPMLTALCPESPVDALYGRLSRLNFVERRRDGLALLDIVRETVAGRLQPAILETVRGVGYRLRL